ncbi:GntR family transcriptional regulator [Serratia nematodiphila]|nr:GntR family transcriptional regulator [Serratia nematodiphila]
MSPLDDSLRLTAKMAPDDGEQVKTLSQKVYRLLLNDILVGEMAPGEKLLLRDLTERYGQGVSPIREALILLASEGLLECEGQKGFRVASVSLSELLDLTATRQQIEKLMLEEAIEKGDTEWESRVVAAHYALTRTPVPKGVLDTAALNLWEARHKAFHLALLSACSSPWMHKIYHQLMMHTERYRIARLLNSPPEGLLQQDIEEQHRVIMTAALERNQAEATRLLSLHIEETADRVKMLWQKKPVD